VVIFRDADGAIPLLEWLDRIPEKARMKCLARMERLAEMGHELRRPEADFLRDGIYELRARLGSVNYRMLYFFEGNAAVVLSHGLTKEVVVPAGEIIRALRNRDLYLRNPALHSAAEAP
jgi:phage-related protein